MLADTTALRQVPLPGHFPLPADPCLCPASLPCGAWGCGAQSRVRSARGSETVTPGGAWQLEWAAHGAPECPRAPEDRGR